MPPSPILTPQEMMYVFSLYHTAPIAIYDGTEYGTPATIEGLDFINNKVLAEHTSFEPHEVRLILKWLPDDAETFTITGLYAFYNKIDWPIFFEPPHKYNGFTPLDLKVAIPSREFLSNILSKKIGDSAKEIEFLKKHSPWGWPLPLQHDTKDTMNQLIKIVNNL